MDARRRRRLGDRARRAPGGLGRAPRIGLPLSSASEPSADEISASGIVSLREVTKENLRDVLSLEVAKEQERFVASNAVSIAQAHFHPDVAWSRAIYAGETPVGFLMLHDEPETATYFLWRFMIDRRHQGLGYGRRALALLVEHVRGRPGATGLSLSHVPGEGNPGPFYARLGFVHTGEEQEGELVMRLDLV